jgi:hypothetical protein
MSTFDDPNREAVGLDPAWVEGTGGQAGDTAEEQAGGDAGLDSMTKDELLAYAQERGISPANASMTKADIIASIQAAEGA